MRGRYSVRVTYPLLLLALVLGAAVLLGWLGVTGTRETSLDLLGRLTEQSTERMRLVVLRNLQGPRKVARLNADLIRNGQLELDDVRKVIPLFFAQLESFEQIGSVLVCNADSDTMWVERQPEGGIRVAIYESGKYDGTCREWSRDSEGNIDGDSIGAYPYSPPDRPWHKAAMAAPREGGWTPLYPWATTDDTHRIGTGRAMAVRDDDGKVMGLLDVGLTVDELSTYLQTIEVSPRGMVFLVDGEGRLVATSAKGASLTRDGALIKAIDSDDPAIAAAGARVQEGLESVIHDGHAFGHATFEGTSGENYLLSTEKLEVDWAPDWTLVTVIPESDLLSGARKVQGDMLNWGIVIVLVAAAGGLLLALSITRPIIALRRTAESITEGDLTAEFAGHGGREFRQLATDLSAMRDGLKERLELQGALEVAMEVQQHLLPSDVPTSRVLDIAAFSTYCDETGGDYYDFPDLSGVEQFEDGSLLIMVGDVTGHGIGAALIMATARASIRTRLKHGGSLGKVLADVNDVLHEDIPGGRFMTLLAMVTSPDGSSFSWAGAGHDPPLIYDPIKDDFEEPDGGGVPLGIVSGEVFEEYNAEFVEEGSILVVGTDGIWETVDPDGEFFGKERLRTLVRDHRDGSSDEIGKAIISSLNEFRQSDRPLDDVTLVVIRKLVPGSGNAV